jgi:hypothetical protein
MKLRTYFGYFITCVAIAIFFSVTVPTVGAQSPIKFANGHSARIPLDIDNNLIRMKVRVNNSRPLTLIFDTGATVNALHPKVISELGLKTGEAVEGTGTGGRIHGNLAGKATISVDGVVVPDQLIVSLPFEAPSGFEFDGVIGYDFIKAFVVEIDYPNKIMTLYDPASYVYRGRGSVVPLDLKNRRTPQLKGTFIFGKKPPVVARLGLDTGEDSAFSLNTPFVERQRLLETQKNTDASFSRGAGGIQQRAVAKAQRVSIGIYSFKNVPVAFAQEKVGAGADTKEDGIIGGEVLRRFRVIIDYSRNRMILEPNKSLNEPIEIDDSE